MLDKHRQGEKSMANTERRKIAKDGKMFIPMNMQGSSGKEYFITVPKLAMMCGIAFLLYVTIGWASSANFNLLGWALIILFDFLIIQFIVRKYILEEDYFYDIYVKTNQLKEATPDLMWRIPFINHTEDGDVAVYDDMKVGCVLQLERDTIVGKAEDSAEKHYDAWSNFYKELHSKNLSFVQLNLMEPSGKDPRLNTLSITAGNVRNNSIKFALELEMGHLKRISNAMLSEFEYFVVYSNTISNVNKLIPDVIECSYALLDGAYSKIRVLTEREIYEIPKSMSNVKFFDGIQAQMNVYLNENRRTPNILKIKQIKTHHDGLIPITDKDKKTLDKLASLVDNGELEYGEWSVKRALDGNISKLNNFNKRPEKVDKATDAKDTKKKTQRAVKPKKERKVRKGREVKAKEPKVDVNNIEDEDDDILL